MAEEQGKPPISIDVGVSAKAEIKAEVPSNSAGRFVDALTDAIRPFTESRGLRADQIRLQREDVLIEIAKRARARLAFEADPNGAIPNRILVPLLEKASLTDANSEELKGAWANLLASASRGGDSSIAIFSDTLSKMDPIHIKFLEDFGRGTAGYTSDYFLTLDSERLTHLITEEFQSLPSDKSEYERVAAFTDAVSQRSRFGGVAIVAGFFADYEIPNRYPNQDFGSEFYYALEALSIIEINKARGNFGASADEIWLKVLRFTPFGFDFFQACSDAKYLRTIEERRML